jgi:diacylglycerol kinase (ATP)
LARHVPPIIGRRPGNRIYPRPPRTIDALGAKVPGSAETPHRTGSWNVVKSGYHAFSGLMWVTPRTPSIRLGIAVVIVLSAGGFLLRFTSVEIALLVLVGTLLIAVETINTSIEMLCDFVEPKHDPKIGKIKDVAAGATAVTEIGGAVAVAILLWPHVWAAIHR